MWKTLSDPILSIVYPQNCSVCHSEVESSDDGIACSNCWKTTKIFDGSEALCSKCGAFLFGSRNTASVFCHRCDGHEYDTAASVGIYEGALSASVLNLKRVPYISRRLQILVITAFERMSADTSYLVIPIPLASRRQYERGFNQAAVLGRIISKHAGLAFDEHSLVRKVHTPMHRAGMDRKARAMTVKNAFEVVRPKLIANRRILLVDDVFTSGETASICAGVLKKNGASSVNVLTLARAA